MPHPWSQDRDGLAFTLRGHLLEVAKLDDDHTDAVRTLPLPRLWERSGLELKVFRAMVRAALR